MEQKTVPTDKIEDYIPPFIQDMSDEEFVTPTLKRLVGLFEMRWDYCRRGIEILPETVSDFHCDEQEFFEAMKAFIIRKRKDYRDLGEEPKLKESKDRIMFATSIDSISPN